MCFDSSIGFQPYARFQVGDFEYSFFSGKVICSKLEPNMPPKKVKFGIKVIQDKVVIDYFADGTQEKAVCHEDDTFSLEQGISVCLFKRTLSALTGDGNGSAMYNNAIKSAVKLYENNRAAEKRSAECERLVAEEEKKRKEEERKRKQAKEQAEREKMIEIQKEAYLRAMKEFNSTEN